MDLNKDLRNAQVNIYDLTPSIRSLTNLLFNKIEELSEEVTVLKMENQKLRDEVNSLKGEQGKPDIRPQTSSKDFSSEKERKDPLKNKAKNHKITIHRTQIYPDPNKHDKNRKIILEASGIAAYQESPDAVKILLVDDAPQFKGITELLALCWIHEGRHYKKLTPYLYLHQQEVDNFLDKFWEYYKSLLAYKGSPDAKQAKALEDEFDVLFATRTGYDALDKRIAMTKAKKEYLLLVLEHPKIPLHNNTSEIAARCQARKRDSSFHMMSQKGTEAKDTFMTIVETTKKHGVNVYNYLYDRITKKYTMTSLATLIRQSSISDQEQGSQGFSGPVAA